MPCNFCMKNYFNFVDFNSDTSIAATKMQAKMRAKQAKKEVAEIRAKIAEVSSCHVDVSVVSLLQILRGMIQLNLELLEL